MIALPQHTTITCPAMIGRDAELSVLGQLLSRAQGGQGSTALVIGEAGVGKSRLVAELVFQAQELGFQILKGGCFELDYALPYAGLLDLLRAQLSLLTPDAIAPMLGPLAPHLIGLLPEYGSLSAQPSLSGTIDPQQERQRITQAFMQFFAYQVRTAPLLVILEDLHWSDEATVGVLLALARRVSPWPVLLLATYRDEQLRPELAEQLAVFGRERLATTMVLGRLRYEQADTMLQAIFSQQRPIRGDFLSALYSLTEGNPFFIEEVLTALVAAGEIYRTADRWERRSLLELHIPPSIQAAVQRRMDALDPQTRQLATLAAVIGRRFDFDLLQRLTERNEAELVRQIKQLIAAQLVVEEAPDRFAFRHALTRAALLAGLLAREQRLLHGQVASAREASVAGRGADVIEAHASDLAHHYAAAGDWARALPYAHMAAAHAQRLYAPAAAVEQLTCAILAAQHLGQTPAMATLRARGSMYDTLGAADAALADYQTALQLAQQHDDRHEQWQTLLAIGFFYAARDSTKMGAYLRQALDLARQLDAPLLLGQSLNRYGNWYLFLEQPREAIRYHNEALAIFQANDDRAGLAATHDLLGVTHIMTADKPAAYTHYQSAIAIFRELGDRVGLASALATVALRGISYYHTTTVPVEDGYAAWVRDGEEALQLARQIEWRSGEANALVYLALIHGASGFYNLADQRSRAAWNLAQEIEHPVWIAGALLARGGLLLDLLDYSAARIQLEQALAASAGLGLFFTRRVAGYLALACIAQQDLERASVVLADLLDETTPMETQGQRLNWLARAELARAEGQPQLALQIAEQLIASAVHAAQSEAGCVPALWQLLGEAQAALGQHSAAEQSLSAAAAGAKRLGLLPTYWRVLRSLARLYQTSGRRSMARNAYAESRAIVATLEESIADQQLRLTFQRGSAPLLPPASAAERSGTANQSAMLLTRREREVAIRIAQGQTNREIAAGLVLGERTIETHISNILAKLSFTSRREIAAWALTVGLARRVE